jgi:hypothetical protein
MKSPLLRVVTLVAMGFCASLLTASIDERQFACEEALANVADCCGEAAARFTCGAACSEIALDLTTADCLRNASCDSMRSSGVCGDPTHAVCE